MIRIRLPHLREALHLESKPTDRDGLLLRLGWLNREVNLMKIEIEYCGQ
jgi:hypothetical protein